jgi:cyanophycinase
VALAFAALLLTPGLGASRDPSVSQTKQSAAGSLSPLAGASGYLLIVGGGKLPEPIRRHFVMLAGGKNARIVIIPTASYKADQPTRLETLATFKAMDLHSVVLLHTRDRRQANDPAFVKPLTEATGVWLTGGDQSRLTAVYHGTAVEKELQRVLERGGVIGGTSAGAAVMSAVMIVGGKSDAEEGIGFGLISGVVVDQHFWNRNRLNRLLSILAKHPECPGVGIDEETALVIHGETAVVEGNGNVRACLCACGSLPASIQVLRDGEKLDVAALVKTAMTRGKAAIVSKSAPTTVPATVGGTDNKTMAEAKSGVAAQRMH